MENLNFTAEGIAALSGFILMLVFAYFPKLRVWYGGLESNIKSFIMLGMLFLSGGIIAVLVWQGIIPSSEPLSWQKVVSIALALLVANQPTYALMPEARDVTAIKAVRDAALLVGTERVAEELEEANG